MNTRDQNQSAKPLMTVLFYYPGGQHTVCEISGDVFDAMEAGAEQAGIGIGEFISQAIAQKNSLVKIPKGFVMVNLSTWEQEEMRELARECGAELRAVLRNSLTKTQCWLRDRVRLQRKTGLPPEKLWRLHFDERNVGHN